MPRGSIRLLPTYRISPPSPVIRASSYKAFSRVAAVQARAFCAPSPTLRSSLVSQRIIPASPAIQRPTRTLSTNKMPELSVEDAKRQAAIRAVQDHFDPSARYVGIGSGTTIVYVVEAIKAASTNTNIQFVPTGYQSRQVIVHAGLTPIAFDSLPPNEILDVAFDGADEVDDELNCIKGGGACLFQEKLVAERAKKFICVADYRKAQSRLLTNWPSIPIEVAPIAAHTVVHALRGLGSPNPIIRSHTLAKTGPVKTDQDFFIIDAPFKALLTPADIAAAAAASSASHSNGGAGSGLDAAALVGAGHDGVWEVQRLSREIKKITGVLEVGIFCGENGVEAQARGGWGGQRPVAAYFGMQDGSVLVRHAKGVDAA